MNDGNATQLLNPLVWRDPRVHLLDDTWLLTIFAVLFATALPWLGSGLAIDFIATAFGLITLGAIHVALAVLAGRADTGHRRGRSLVALHALGIIAIAYVWQHVGGLQNPLFLAVFVLPVIGSIFLSRWQPYVMAALATIVVALFAAIDAPELRWYAPGLNAAAHTLESMLGRGSISAGSPFAGFYAPSEYFVVLLEVFAIVLFACAIAADYLGTVFERLHDHVAGARSEAQRGQQLWLSLLEQLPLPAFLVDANTCETCLANAAALAKFDPAQAGFLGRNFVQALPFSYPEVVQELVSGAGGVAHACMIRVGDKLLATELRVQHLAYSGRRLALVIVTDATEAFCVRAALDAAEHAAVVVNAQGRVLAYNRPATALFPAAQVDLDVAGLLPQPEREARWWAPGFSGRRKMHLTIAHRAYLLTSSAVALPGEDERLYVLAFVPAAQAATADQSGSTVLTPVVKRV
jgi:PAS domain-containing protein